MKKHEIHSGTKQTLLWAVDPRQSETRPSSASVQGLVQMAKRLNWEIRPVYAFSPSLADLNHGLFQCVSDAQALLNSYVKSFSLPDCDPKVIAVDVSGQDEAVKRLVHFARQSNASAIAVSSHGRSGIDRLFLGSFAEAVLRSSPFPVFFLNQENVQAGEAIFFPTDFSSESHSSYHQFLSAASGTKAKLTLFHAVTYPLPADMGMGSYLPDNFLLEQETWAKEEAVRWVGEAKRNGIEARSVVRVGGIGNLSSDDILAAAAEFNAGVVVLTTKSNALERTLFGGTAFPVFRANHCLTLVYGPQTIRRRVSRAKNG